MARFRRKDLKRPDVFLTTSQRIIEWGISHQRELAIAGATAIAALLLIAGYGVLSSARMRQANEELGVALNEFRAERFAAAAPQLATVADGWTSIDVGTVARLYAADAYLAAGNPAEAKKQLEKALSNPLPAAYLNQQAVLNLGLALERENDLVAAADQYRKALEMDGPYRALALLREARAREKLSDKDRAEELYETFIAEFPGQPEVQVLEAKLGAS